jgi:carbamoyl-phosphate synthase large subunit
MGNPHAVVFCENAGEIDLSTVGPAFENDALFPDRVNAEFVEAVDGQNINLRVWERGSGETLACGTGACAAAAAAVLNGYCEAGADIRVHLPGGVITVNYTSERVYMTGDCVKVFDGIIDI